MGQKTRGKKGSGEKGKARRKLSDLSPKRVKGGDAAAVKAGMVILNQEKWIRPPLISPDEFQRM